MLLLRLLAVFFLYFSFSKFVDKLLLELAFFYGIIRQKKKENIMKKKPIVTAMQEIQSMKKTISQTIDNIDKSYKRINMRLTKILNLIKSIEPEQLELIKSEIRHNVVVEYKDHESIRNALLDAYNSKTISQKTRDKCLVQQENLMKLEKEIMDMIG